MNNAQFQTYKKKELNPYQEFLYFLSCALWAKAYVPPQEPDYSRLFDLCKMHAIPALPTDHLVYLKGMDDELKKRWKKEIYAILVWNNRVMEIQREITACLKEQGVDFVILKGTSASCYYPKPAYRTQGDIDVFPRREMFEKAQDVLIDAGFTRLPDDEMDERHYHFELKGVTVELHGRFAVFKEAADAQFLDDLILDHIGVETKLPDDINGLVLLQHMNQHLALMMGLRQVIDWMYYVKAYLTDERWQHGFSEMAERLGLKNLAITVTRMCQLYLGLDPLITWCADADEELCANLMLYILESGNFGSNKKANTDAVSNVALKYKNSIDFIRIMQRKGMKEWEAVQKHRILVPFAWLHQSFCLVRLSLKRRINLFDYWKGYLSSRKRRKMLQQLGAWSMSDGIAQRVDGEYVNKRASH